MAVMTGSNNAAVAGTIGSNNLLIRIEDIKTPMLIMVDI